MRGTSSIAKLVMRRSLQRDDLSLARMRLHEADDYRAGFQLPDLFDRQRLHGEHDVRLLSMACRVEPLDVLVVRIGEACARSGAALHGDACAARGEFVRRPPEPD
jgi:hypothetical protein